MEPQVGMMTNCMVIGFSALVANRQKSYKKSSQESLKGLTSVFREDGTKSSISKGEKLPLPGTQDGW